MRNFETELDKAGVNRIVKQTSVVIREEVTVTKRQHHKTYLASTGEAWTWRQLRDYVENQIESRFGPIERDANWTVRTAGVFKGFVNRWGDKAPAIARYAFERCDGEWMNEPVSVSRFTKGNDPYFAHPISLRMLDAPVQGW